MSSSILHIDLLWSNRMSDIKSQAPRYLRARELCDYLQIAPSTLWVWAKTRPGFPVPIKAGPKVTLFDVHAIEAFLRQC